jgi:hypothetical protein
VSTKPNKNIIDITTNKEEMSSNNPMDCLDSQVRVLKSVVPSVAFLELELYIILYCEYFYIVEYLF